MKDSKEIYEKRKNKYEELSKELIQTTNFISALRFITFSAGIGFFIFLYFHKRYVIGSAVLSVSFICFIVLIVKHSRLIIKRNLVSELINVNEHSIKRKEGLWREFEDTGDEFKDTEHNYSDDLDIFGKSSLFQWINTAQTSAGRKKLAEYLAFPKLNIEHILKKQKAIKELAKQVGWRQRLEAEGVMSFKENRESAKLLLWSKEYDKSIHKTYFKIMLWLQNILTITTISYYLINSGKTYVLPLVFILINMALLKIGENIRNNSLNTAYENRKKIRTYLNILLLIENKKFKAEYLYDLQKRLQSVNGIKASAAIEKLTQIVERISDRNNAFTMIFNLLFLYDFYLVFALETWKAKFGSEVEKWLEVIGEFEAMSSIALLYFDNPDWVTPNFESSKLIVMGKGLAHPLLAKGAVANDITVGVNNSIILITGSNMSGKSTFLRTIGLNLILSYSGAPVSGKSFVCSLMDIYTCMRISDNLEKNISSFYAEILRIKKIVTASKDEKPLFFLLDEIFKGTNSMDRHTGAEALINSLSESNALGFVSTHDLELGDLEAENSKVKNYNFQEFYNDNKIHFDYKLREGVSKTRNAVYIMKLAGIEFNN